MPESNLQFRVNLFNANGRLLLTSEFTQDRAAVIHIIDTINENCRCKLRAAPETKGTGYVTPPQHTVIG